MQKNIPTVRFSERPLSTWLHSVIPNKLLTAHSFQHGKDYYNILFYQIIAKKSEVDRLIHHHF